MLRLDRVETEHADVVVGQPLPPVVLAQLTAAPSDPGRGLVEFRARRLRLELRFRAAVGEEVVGGEGAVSEEACPDAYPPSAARNRAR